MRSSQNPPTLLSLLAVVLSSSHITNAKPYPSHVAQPLSQNSTLELRQCAVPCGYYNQYCCSQGQYCYTNANNQAACGNGAPNNAVNGVSGGGTTVTSAGANVVNGQWQWFTTTYVATDLVTIVSTYSSYIGAAPVTSQAPYVQPATTAAAPVATTLSCNPALNEVSCGDICCAQGQFCQVAGSCAAYGGSSGSVQAATNFVAPSSTSSAGAFIRPTSNTATTITSTQSPTTTTGFQTPVGTDGSAITGMTASNSNNGLSGGAIAGIVIGTLLGIALLLLLCFCCCVKGLLDGVLAFFGFRNRNRRREETVIEERYSHHGGGGRDDRRESRTWFGNRPSRVDQPKKNGIGGLTAVLGGLGALAVLLGLKRRRDRRNEEKSNYGSASSYSYYTGTSESE
ncbi:hypothetical protein MMC09_003482 [Bachmanniomyces sp. S44760]|nr:hypothetical protein [Bachmanniomyces sp. S44760]